MKKTLLILSLSSLALAACSKSNQTPTDASTASQAEAASQALVVEASQVTPAETASSQAEALTPPVEGNAQTSLDWSGTYKGSLPCASCEAIETKLTLNQDKTYVISETYQGKGDGKPFENKGKFSFDQTGNVITLDAAGDKRQYFISENHIIALDQEGKIIQGSLAKNYELQKQP